VSSNLAHGGVIVSMLTSSVVDFEFYKIRL